MRRASFAPLSGCYTPGVRRKRSLRRWLIAIAAVLGVGTIVFLLLFPTIGRAVVRRKVLPKVAALLGRDVFVDSIRVGYGDAVLEGVTLRGPADAETPLVRVERITVEYDFKRALVGDVRLGKVVIHNPVITMSRDASGKDNWSDVVKRVRDRRRQDEGGGQGGQGGRRGPTDVEVRGGALTFVDDQAGLSAAVGAIDGTARPGEGGKLTLRGTTAGLLIGPKIAGDVVIEVDLDHPGRPVTATVTNGRASLIPTLSLTGVKGTVTTRSGRAEIAFSGGYGGVDETLWRADGAIDLETRNGDLHLVADRFTLDKLAPILAGTPVQTPEEAAISARLDLDFTRGDVAFTGAVDLAGLTLFHPAVAESPIEDLAFTSTVRGRYGARSRVFALDELTVRVEGVEARIDGEAAFAGGLDPAGPRVKPRLRGHVVIPKVGCQQMLQAIPPALAPKLQGFKLAGNFATDVSFSIDWADLEATTLGGSVGIFACKPKEAPEAMDAKRLLEEFEHFVEVEQDNWISFVVGPSNPDYVPLADVSPHVINSFMTTEDSGFFKHRGFIVREFRSALVRNLEEGYFKYGASSITMQLVKNVLLYREKTLSRKLQELFLTWYIETQIPKDRILEIYVNVIEFGPGIYGVGPAARHYFGKHPRDLNPVEAAFFSSILPSPKRRYMQYCEGQLNRWGDAKVQRIIKKMRERDRLTEPEYQQALATPLVFDRTYALPERECKEMVKKLIKKARPTGPGSGVADPKNRDKKKQKKRGS